MEPLSGFPAVIGAPRRPRPIAGRPPRRVAHWGHGLRSYPVRDVGTSSIPGATPRLGRRLAVLAQRVASAASASATYGGLRLQYRLVRSRR
jgi:hypothetical protein